jgi:type II secretory pathway component GspD/PulD (secretin)
MKKGEARRRIYLLALPLALLFQCTSSDKSGLGQEQTQYGLPQLADSSEMGAPVPTNSEPLMWTVNFQAAPWPVVLKEFSKAFGFSLSMTIEPEGTFSFHDSRPYSTTDVLDILNDQLIPNGFLLIRNDQRLVVVKTDKPISDSLVPFVSLSELDYLGRNEFVGTAIPVRGGDPLMAVSEIELIKSSVGNVRSFANSQRIVVMDTGTHLRRIRDLLLRTGFARSDTLSAVYQLKHAKAEDVSKAIEEFLNSQAGSEFAGAISTESDRVVAEKTTNSLLVRGSQETLPVLMKIIADLDRSPREVLLQALIVEVLVSNTKEFGVEVGLQDSVLFDRSIVNSVQTISQTSTAPNGVQTTDQRILSQQVSPGFQFNGPTLGNNSANPGRIGSQGLANFGVGRVNNELGFGGLVLSAGSESVSVLLRALDAKFGVDVLSRPQVRTVENKEAFIQVGQQVPIVDGVVVNAVGSANPIVRQDKAGIILRATPRISPDGRVQIDVNTEKSAFILTRGSGVPIFTDATTGRVIEAPVKDITTASTTVSVQSGETVVLGGMITNSESVVHRKVPWLGDIPLLGRLFRYDSNQFARKELIVFLTPVTLNDEEKCFHLDQELSTMKMTPVTTEMLERWNQFKGILPAPSMIESQPTIPNGMNGIDGTLPSPIEEPLANPQQYETVLAVPSSSQARLP